MVAARAKELAAELGVSRPPEAGGSTSLNVAPCAGARLRPPPRRRAPRRSRARPRARCPSRAGSAVAGPRARRSGVVRSAARPRPCRRSRPRPLPRVPAPSRARRCPRGACQEALATRLSSACRSRVGSPSTTSPCSTRPRPEHPRSRPRQPRRRTSAERRRARARSEDTSASASSRSMFGRPRRRARAARRRRTASAPATPSAIADERCDRAPQLVREDLPAGRVVMPLIRPAPRRAEAHRAASASIGSSLSAHSSTRGSSPPPSRCCRARTSAFRRSQRGSFAGT